MRKRILALLAVALALGVHASSGVARFPHHQGYQR